MPLPDSAAREKLHHRSIQCEGFRRTDGLWDIEAHLTDQRSYDCSYDPLHRGGLIRAGEFVHDMRVRLTLDLDFVIHAAVAVSDDTPFPVCSRAALAMQQLVGLRMGKGWLREARKRISTDASCTHLMDLLNPLMATAYQTLHAALEERVRQQQSENKLDNQLVARKKPPILDTCLALASDGEVVKRRWSEFYTGERDNG